MVTTLQDWRSHLQFWRKVSSVSTDVSLRTCTSPFFHGKCSVPSTAHATTCCPTQSSCSISHSCLLSKAVPLCPESNIWRSKSYHRRNMTPSSAQNRLAQIADGKWLRKYSWGIQKQAGLPTCRPYIVHPDQGQKEVSWCTSSYQI